MKSQNKIFKALGIYLAIFFMAAGIASAVDDDVPFFAGNTGNPNVFLIFDNSDSMQDSPYLRNDGNTYRPSTYWRRGATVDGNGTIAENDSGGIIYDDYKYVSTDTTLTLPGANPPTLPGLGTRTSTVTYIAGPSSNRIDDSSVVWTDASVAIWSAFAANYRYWKVKITDANGAEQVRTITSYSTGGRWYVDQNIDYSGPEPYTYEIMTGLPGGVTLSSTSDSNRRVYDRHFDWSTITDWSSFSSNYRYKILEIYEGANAGETRGIYDRSSGSRYWRLDSALPVPCDYSTRYRILGTNDDNKYATGGNHPDSKLYQAKQALTAFLESNSIQSNGDYRLNMGFATYMSARIPRVRAKYYRKRAGTTTSERYYIKGYYKRTTNHSTYEYHPTSDSEFDDDWGGQHTGVSVGFTFDRLYQEDKCSEQTITYTVTAIEDAPTDSLPNRHRFRFNGDYVQYDWENMTVASCTPGPLTVADLPDRDGWSKVIVGDDCYDEQEVTCHYVPESTNGSYYQTYTWKDTYGDYSITDPATPGYIDPVSGMVTPYKGYCSGSWNCSSPVPDPASGDGDWTLLEADLVDVPVNSNGDLGTITSVIFDYSYFRYPGEGDDDQPHAWSNRRAYRNGDIDNRWVYRYSTSYKAKWRDDMQPAESFPADVGDEKANHTGDDQVVFVNLPTFAEGDDEDGDNVAAILNYINLSRVPYPYSSSYVKTMMPYTSSLAVNSSQAVTGKGTPLEATLKDALRYYTSYINQDSYTQGGCRNNYIILLTDGLDTCADGADQDARNAKVVAAAEDLYDLSIGDVLTPIKTFVIGFGLDASSAASLNAIAAAGGTEQAYFATNVEELVEVLSEDIMDEIQGDSYTRSAPVVPRLREGDTIDDLKIYYTYFDYPVWKGHLNGYQINEEGIISEKISGWSSACDSESGPDADAGCEIASNGRGTSIYTVIDENRTLFSSANLADLKSLVNPNGTDINLNGTLDEDADAEAVIGYTLDPGYDSGKYLGTRDEDWPLGDIYHSSPVVVTRPNFDVNYTGYQAFSDDHLARETMLYVGANDGMLHAINAADGREDWAWIPNSVLGKLYEFTYGHRFTVDLLIKGADMDISQDCAGTGWKSMIVSGLRQGGNHYFAIDVTNSSDPVHMWEMTDDNATDGSATGFPGADIPGEMGQTWSIPAFGRLNINGNPTSVIFVGGGYSTDENKGNRVYILNAGTGKILKEIEAGASTNNVPSELRTLRFLLNDADTPVDYFTRESVDQDQETRGFSLKGFIEDVYFGGTDGTLYKITGLNEDSGWDPQVEVLYVPENPRPIYYPPSIKGTAVKDFQCSGKGRRFIYFGTGDENDPTNSESIDYFYEIEDREYDDSGEGLDNDSSCTDEQIAAGRFRLSWQYFHEIPDPENPDETIEVNGFPAGEKVLSYSTFYNNVAYFTTYQSAGGCDMGESYLYGLTGSGCKARPAGDCGAGYVDAGGNGGLKYNLEGEQLNPCEKSISLGKGIATSPIIVTQPKKVDFTPTMYIQIPTGGGGGMTPPVAVKVPGGKNKLIYWNDIN